jgi:nucleoside-diphosphate-sugar epimerase
MYAPEGAWVKDKDAPFAIDAPPPMSEAVAAVVDLETQVLEAGGVSAELARKRQLPVIGSGDACWSFIHVDDAAAATVAALEQGSSGVYNIVDDEPAPARDWVPVYAASVGAKPPRRLPAWLARLVGGPAGATVMTTQRGASNAKATRELGWTPRYGSWRDGFRAGAT